jgi:small subunit ribosomal protein S20
MRNALRDLRASEKKQDFEKKLPEMVTMIDRLAKKNVIHKNKAGNLKSSLMKKLQSMK